MERYAVLISCEQYKDYDDINYCHSDLSRLSETLCRYCDYNKRNIEELLMYIDENNKDNRKIVSHIYEIVQETIKNIESEDTFLLFFAGHGMKYNDDEYFILPNTNKEDIEGTALSLKYLNSILKRSKGHTFRIFDACHSGKDIRGVQYSTVERGTDDRSWITFASCSENENSYSDNNLEQGVFTYYLTEEIRKWKLGDKITFEKLKPLVCKEVEEWSKKNNKTQNPTLNCSIVGEVFFAERNTVEYEYAYVLQAYDNNIESFKEGNEIDMELSVNNNYNAVLWEPNAGIQIHKNADFSDILRESLQLKKTELDSIINSYDNCFFEQAAETIWLRAISLLRRRVLTFGEEFVGEMVGINKIDYIKDLPAFEVLNLGMELGFINDTGKLRLMQAYDIIQHFLSRETKEEMTKSECESINRACIQYILGVDETIVSYSYSDFRELLKTESFDNIPEKLKMLKNSPYFYKRTTIRTFINLISSTQGAEYENVIANFKIILPAIWSDLSSEDKYFIGIQYSSYVDEGAKDKVVAIKDILDKIGGFDYVPENIRSSSFVEKAKYIKGIHYSINNFYNEPMAIRSLGGMGTKIPKPAIKEVVSATCVVLLGNSYGVSWDAVEPAKSILGKLTEGEWVYYIEQCLPYDVDVLYKLQSGGDRVGRWCNIIKEFQLEKFNFSNTKVKRFIKDSSNDDINNVRATAEAYIKALNRNVN